jgi:hypothetical protein
LGQLISKIKAAIMSVHSQFTSEQAYAIEQTTMKLAMQVDSALEAVLSTKKV